MMEKIQECQAPIRHWVVDELVPTEMALAAYEATPPADWPHWARYNNDCERRKRTCNQRQLLPQPWATLLNALNSLDMVVAVSRIANLEVEADDGLYGAGIHVTDPGGWLQPHLDYAACPHRPGMERRLNMVLFLNPEWKPEWGGAFAFYDDLGREAHNRVMPAFNRAVIWEASDVAFHGVEQVAHNRKCAACGRLAAGLDSCDRGVCQECWPAVIDGDRRRHGTETVPPPRVTAAAYYLAPARPGVTRKRALFVPRRN